MIPVGAWVERDQRGTDEAVSREAHTQVWSTPSLGGMTRLIAGAPGPPKGRYDTDIIILVLERVEETLAAIASASEQTGVSVHIFVLDQGSCSETLERLAQTVRVRRDVTLLAAERNLGVAGGRNLISGLGHGRVIVALDNDAEFGSPDTVARMVAALDAEPRLGAIGCRIVTYAGGEDDLSSWGYPVGLLSCAGESFNAVTYVGAGHAILRDAWQQAGGYDSKLFFCWEEFDFCLRAIALGWWIRYRGDIVIRHKVCAEQRVGWTAARWFYFVRNRIYIERKLDHGWFALLPRIAGYILKGIRNGLPVQTLCAIHAAARMAPRSRHPMPLHGLSYLTRNDLAYRGSIWRRLVREVLCRINVPRDVASPAKR
jgi:GT2 family glycosyltransferase